MRTYCSRSAVVSFPTRLTQLAPVALLLVTCACDNSAKYVSDPYSQRVLRTETGAEYLAHEVIVRLNPFASQGELEAAVGQLGGEIVERETGLASVLGFLRIKLPGTVIADQAISALQEEGVVEAAERNYIVTTVDGPNDPMLSQLWGMQKIQAEQSWRWSTGSRDVLVVVSDTGVDRDHEDLVGNMWVNPNEVAGNGIDDDSNGYVDDVHGWDWANNDNDPGDDHGHGTHCSGTIGGVGNNGIGVVGVNWRSRIMALKFLSASGSGTLYNGAQSILYAASQNAAVVNASWGCLGCNASYVEEAIERLREAGGLFVAAAGNDSNNNDSSAFYPASYSNDNVVAVAATDANDVLAYFSNWGASKVHLAAPGVSILSSLPGDQYASWSGTSMAAPHVAGAAALYLSLHPNASYGELKQRLVDTCDPVSGLQGKVIANGRLNALNLLAADSEPPQEPQDVTAVAGERSNINVTWSVGGDEDVVMYRLYWGTVSGSYPTYRDIPGEQTSSQLNDLENGVRYFIALRAIDLMGNLSPLSREVTAIPQDRLAPPQVIDLRATTVVGVPASPDVVIASSEASDYYSAVHATDGSPDTAWLTGPETETDQSFLIIQFNQRFALDRVVLKPNAAYPEFFPLDYDIEVSDDGSNWIQVAAQRDTRATPEQQVELRFPVTEASALRLKVLRSFQHSSGYHYVGLAEITAYQVSEAPDKMELFFSAPGDDPGSGRADRYDIRYSLQPLTLENFSLAASIASSPPGAAGVLERVEVRDLLPETEYYFALLAIDEADNTSPLSNVAFASTSVIPPSTISDLTVAQVGTSEVTLNWTAPGDNGGQGQASGYDLRFAEFALNAANFEDATAVAGVAPPAAAGSLEQLTVNGLQQSRLYYFAVRAVDASGAQGSISNVVSVIVDNSDDQTPPAAVQDLAVFASTAQVKLQPTVVSSSSSYAEYYSAANILDGNFNSLWLSKHGPATEPEWVVLDFGEVVPLTRVQLRPPAYGGYLQFFPQALDIQVSADQSNWSPLIHVEGLSAELGVWYNWSAPVTYTRYARLHTTLRGSQSCMDPGGCTGSAYVAIAELEAYAPTPEFDVDLVWVAPGDDGWIGTATSYDLRHATAPIDEDNFDQWPVVATELPQPAGMVEVLGLQQLEHEQVHHFALRVVDDSGNQSALSNVATITTPAVPPAPVTDLLASRATVSSIELRWTATGDDGFEGVASAYDIRFFTSPLTESNWDYAYPVATSFEPEAAGSLQELWVENLQSNTLYYFALRVVDDWGNASLLSNVAQLETLDGVAPSTVVDLLATPVDARLAPPLTPRVIDSSGSYSPETSADNLLDGDVNTVWLSSGTAELQPEYVVLKLDSPTRLGRLRLLAAPGNADLFPIDFVVEVRQQEDTPWTAVLQERDFITAGEWEEWQLGSVAALEVRLLISSTASWSGLFYAELAELELYADPTDFNRVRLSWTAPGDDGQSGRATLYDLRMASVQIRGEQDFASAAVVPGVAAPLLSGRLERLEVGDLQPESEYCFALKAADERDNLSALSNSPCVTTPGLPPGTVTDLSAGEVSASAATLVWTAPGDDGFQGRASSYQMRMSQQRITVVSWDQALPLENLPIPEPAGSLQQHRVSGLAGLSRYYFALRAVDSSGNLGAISNNAAVDTLDDVAPESIVDLAAETVSSAWGTLRLSWTAPGDNGPFGQAEQYDLRIAKHNIHGGNFPQLLQVATSAPLAAGEQETLLVADLDPEALYYVALVTSDSAGNTSGLSNVPSGRTRDEAPAAVTDLAVIGSSGDEVDNASVLLRWTAPGDDELLGFAAAYDLRYSTSPINPTNFVQAEVFGALPTPGAPGVVQSVTVDGLVPGRLYYFALRTVDERDNWSALSNTLSVTTADGIAPQAVTNLVVRPGPSFGSVWVRFTSPHDVGPLGGPSQYDLRVALGPITADNFSQAQQKSLSTPLPAGEFEVIEVAGLLPESPYYVAIKAIDAAGNISAISNVAEGWSRDEAPSAVTDLAVVGSTGAALDQATVALSWRAPGDDGQQGRASRYELRYSTSPLYTSNFESATPVANVAAPSSAGSTEGQTVGGLQPGTRYYFALRTGDERDNWSGLSNIAVATTPDEVAPNAVQDLEARTGDFRGAILLAWTNPGDDGDQGTVARYDLRYSKLPIGDSNFAAATPVHTQPPGGVAGGGRVFVASGLPDEDKLYLALRAQDDAGNWSGLSNVIAARTPDVAPGQVRDLTALSSLASSISVGFTAPGDDGSSGTATAYELRYSMSSLTEGNFAQAHRVPTPVPSQAQSAERVTIAELVSNSRYYIGLKTVDERGNWSVLSTVLVTQTADAIAPSTIVDLVASTGEQPRTIRLQWTAPGDDGQEGRANTYLLRRSSSAITPDNWNAAIAVTGLPLPGAAGSAQAFVASGLPGETLVFFAIRALDEAGNQGALASSVSAWTPPIAPSGVTDLEALPSAQQVQLMWTASGDDGTTGTATTYDVRYSTQPINKGNFLQATPVAQLPAPGPSGSAESCVVSGLLESTEYWFALVVADEFGAQSPLSNMLQVTTLDATAPDAPGAVSSAVPTHDQLLLRPVDYHASSQLSQSFAVAMAFDDQAETAWASQGSEQMEQQTVTIDLGERYTVDRLRLLPSGAYVSLFPRQFEVQLSDNGQQWSPVVLVSEFAATSASWLSWGFAPEQARYLRLQIGDSAVSYFGLRYSVISEIQVYQSALDGQVRLTWVAPGDDGQSGVVQHYLLYQHQQPFSEQTLGEAQLVARTPVPEVAGTLQSMVLAQLEGETTYYWALKAVDEAGNVSALSEVTSCRTSAVAPAPVADLHQSAADRTWVELSWTASGDDGSVGQAASYEMRYASWSLTNESFPFATRVDNMAPPAVSGQLESVVVSDLAPGTQYRFGIVVRDESGTASYLSNSIVVSTTPDPDTQAPAQVSDLSVGIPSEGGEPILGTAVQWSSQQPPDFVATAAADGDLFTMWSSAARSESGEEWLRIDLGSTQAADRVRVWPAQDYASLFPLAFSVRVSPDGLNWQAVMQHEDCFAQPGQPFAATFPVVPVRYVEWRAQELAPFDNGYYYAVVAEVEVMAAASAPGTLLATWTAPGDDATVGRAETYDLRLGTCPYDHLAALPILTQPPQQAGQQETLRIVDLAAGKYCLGLITEDEASNRSELSNVVEVEVLTE